MGTDKVDAPSYKKGVAAWTRATGVGVVVALFPVAATKPVSATAVLVLVTGRPDAVPGGPDGDAVGPTAVVAGQVGVRQAVGTGTVPATFPDDRVGLGLPVTTLLIVGRPALAPPGATHRAGALAATPVRQDLATPDLPASEGQAPVRRPLAAARGLAQGLGRAPAVAPATVGGPRPVVLAPVPALVPTLLLPRVRPVAPLVLDVADGADAVLLVAQAALGTPTSPTFRAGRARPVHGVAGGRPTDETTAVLAPDGAGHGTPTAATDALRRLLHLVRGQGAVAVGGRPLKNL